MDLGRRSGHKSGPVRRLERTYESGSAKTGFSVNANTHERMASSADKPMGSDRSFGFVFTAFFAAVGGWVLFASNVAQAETVGWGLFALSAICLALALAAPGVLHGPNRAWMAFGNLLHRLVSPVVLGFLWVAVITPTAIVRRLLGHDSMRRGFEAGDGTYWVHRDPPGPSGASLKDQF